MPKAKQDRDPEAGAYLPVNTSDNEEHETPREPSHLAPDKDVLVSQSAAQNRTLMISFGIMVVVGLMNKIFQKLQTIPMYNYPNFLNMFTTFVYIPASFAYIYPMAKAGRIPKEQLELPKRPFVVMGGLDALAGIMQTFAATYLNGSLLILLMQSAIPISMVLSKYMLGEKYSRWQYGGALIVAAGIMIVLGPSLEGGEGSEVIWSVVLIVSAIPMTLSSIYKQIALGEQDLDPVFLNGWIAIFQFLFSLPLAIPAALVSDPPVSLEDLPTNLANGMKCYVGISSHTSDDDHPDECYPYAPTFVTLYLFFNILYNILIILILKYGSANILWLSFTIMVPLGNVAFTLPFMPERTTLQPTDIIGLVVIVSGLILYRFADQITGRCKRDRTSVAGLLNPLLASSETSDDELSLPPIGSVPSSP